MSFLNGGILGLVNNKLSYLTQKQSVLAENVANANTPDYKAKTLEPFQNYVTREMKGENDPMKTTDNKHIIPAALAGTNSKSTKMDSFETVPSGNSVDLEQQMIEVTNTQIDYQSSIAIYRKFSTLFRTAIGK